MFAEGGKRRNGRPAFIIIDRRITSMPSQIFANQPKAADITNAQSSTSYRLDMVDQIVSVAREFSPDWVMMVLQRNSSDQMAVAMERSRTVASSHNRSLSSTRAGRLSIIPHHARGPVAQTDT